MPDEEKVASIQAGVDDKTSVMERLGSPTNVGTFQTDVWYYISSREEQTSFYMPETIDRKVLAITFDASGKVANIENYTLEHGKQIAFVDRETPTRGKEMTLLQQLFGNIGRGIGGVGDQGTGSTPSGGQ